MTSSTTSYEDALSNHKLYLFIQEVINYLCGKGVIGDRSAEIHTIQNQLQGAWLRSMSSQRAPLDDDDRDSGQPINDTAFDSTLSHIHPLSHTRADKTFSAALRGKLGETGALLGQYLDAPQEDRLWIQSHGTEAYATYLPIHYFTHQSRLDTRWGVYISIEGVLSLANAIRSQCAQWQLKPAPRPDLAQSKRYKWAERRSPQLVEAGMFCEIAYQVLLRHELEHYKVEAFTLHAELLTGRSLYMPYVEEVYAHTWPDVECIEEGLANQTVLDSNAIDTLFCDLYGIKQDEEPAIKREFRRAWNDAIKTAFFSLQPDGYRPECYLDHWRQRHSTSQLGIEARREAMNYLCNQILGAQIRVPDPLVPYYAFPPDNNFLRATDLVPVHLISSISHAHRFMEQATPKMRAFKPFLEALGWRDTGDHMGDHEIWQLGTGAKEHLNKVDGNHVDPQSYQAFRKAMNLSYPDFSRAFSAFMRTDHIPDDIQARIQLCRRITS